MPDASPHQSRPSVATLRYRGRVRPVCASCDLQIVRILNALDAQVLDTLIDECRDEVRDFIEASERWMEENDVG